MTTITIFGVGLIGGSLALCFKDKPGFKVIGHSPRSESVQKYLQRGVVDEGTTSLEEAALQADFIFICVPIGMLNDYLKRLSELPLKPGCVISDVGSTKRSVSDFAQKLDWQSDVHFIGGHPMAGSERSGVEAASSHLFENAFYVLTPYQDTPSAVYEHLTKLLQHTRAQLVKMDPQEHDEIVGAVSHLPHLIAVALVNLVCSYNVKDDMYSRLAAGGFRDITRIASSDPIVWRDILLNNRQVLLRLLDDWDEQMTAFRTMLENGDGERIMHHFEKSGKFRGSLPERRKGVINAMYDVFVDIPDHPGVIGQIATQLGSSQLNLSNIQIYESRMDVPGVLRLSFRNQHDQDKAITLLKELDYSVHV